ncbi:MAG TPA: hypothetical protein VN873_11050 [Candidatus Angelobacter sp.]|nr:hypothetical protein [Candidatus Angelobacter sp.]
MSTPNTVDPGYIEDWRKVLVEWLGWKEERLKQFVFAWNAKLTQQNGGAWFYHEPPIYHVVPLLVRDRFDERLQKNMRRPEYGAPEWAYFHREMQLAIEGADYYTDHFNWDAARERAVKHLARYDEIFPLPEEVTNYETRILAFKAAN